MSACMWVQVGVSVSEFLGGMTVSQPWVLPEQEDEVKMSISECSICLRGEDDTQPEHIIDLMNWICLSLTFPLHYKVKAVCPQRPVGLPDAHSSPWTCLITQHYKCRHSTST